jgi:hypothetical protein
MLKKTDARTSHFIVGLEQNMFARTHARTNARGNSSFLGSNQHMNSRKRN